MSNLFELSSRKQVPVYTKMKPKPDGSHLVNYKNEKDYDYYKCDYCGEEIKILSKKQEMTGGTIKFPHLVTKKGDIELALHNKCLRAAIKLFEEERKNEQ